MLPFETDAYKRYQSPQVFADDKRIYRHAKALVVSLLDKDGLSLFTDKSTLSPKDRLFIGHLLKFYTALYELTVDHVSFSEAKPSACLLYEYHPYIELLQEFALRYRGYTAFNTAPDTYIRVVRPTDPRTSADRASLAFQLWNVMEKIRLLDELRLEKKSKLTERQLNHIRFRAGVVLCKLRRFLNSSEVQQYLDRRLNTHNSVFGKAISYISGIVQGYKRCFMSMIELHIDGSQWADDTIRAMARLSSTLIKNNVTESKKYGLIGHAWRLDTIRIVKSEDAGLGRPVWRLRWMVFVDVDRNHPSIAATWLLQQLCLSARKLQCPGVEWGDASGRVVHPMTLLEVSCDDNGKHTIFVNSEPDKNKVFGYSSQIHQWVTELVTSDFYRRIRILEGRRPNMCGRGHVADEKVRRRKPVPWNSNDDRLLENLWRSPERLTCRKIGEYLGKSREEIMARLVRLGIV